MQGFHVFPELLACQCFGTAAHCRQQSSNSCCLSSAAECAEPGEEMVVLRHRTINMFDIFSFIQNKVEKMEIRLRNIWCQLKKN